MDSLGRGLNRNGPSLDRSVLQGIESRNVLTESISGERVEEGIPRAK